MKRILSVIICVLLSSCDYFSNEIPFDENAKTNISKLLFTENYKFLRVKNDFILTVNNSELKTDLETELAASLTTHILYKAILNKYNELIGSVQFKIYFSNSNLEYVYSLLDVSDSIRCKESIEGVFQGLFENKNPIEFVDVECNKGDYDYSGIDWSAYDGAGFYGFENIESELCEKKIDQLLYRVGLVPSNTEIWFYVNKKNYKVLGITLPPG